MTCPQCGTVYDVSNYSPGHSFACQCGRNLTVGAESYAATSAPGGGGFTAGPRGPDNGLDGGIKALLFFLNLCFTPLVGLVWWLIIRNDKPRTAKDVCTFTWIPAIIAIVLWVLYMMFVGVAMLGSM